MPEYANIDLNDLKAVSDMKIHIANLYLREKRTDALQIDKLEVNGHNFENVKVVREGFADLEFYPQKKYHGFIQDEGLPGSDVARKRLFEILGLNDNQ